MAKTTKKAVPVVPVPPQEHAFTLVLSGLRELTPQVCDALYEGGCDDATPASRDGVVYLDFDREAGSYREAVLSAIANVEGAGAGIRVVRVEPDDFVSMAEIARRAKRTREGVRQFIQGVRGPGDFPPPVANVSGRSPIWRWSEVARWLSNLEGSDARSPTRPGAAARLRNDSLTAAINATLELRRNAESNQEAMALYKAIVARRPARRPSARAISTKE